MRPNLSLEMILWLLAMLRNCTESRYAINKERMVRLAQYSRKPVVTPEKLAKARALVAEGLNVREAASRIKVSKSALYAAMKK